MEKFIIQYDMKVDGKRIVAYHQDIEANTSKETMNAYVEHLTKDRSRARRFFQKEEAIRIANVFSVAGISNFFVIKA